MADLHDVETVLVDTIAAAAYPNGTGQASSIVAPVRVFAGWPKAQALDADLAAGVVNVSVFAVPNASKVTSRYPREWQTSVLPPATMTVNVTGQQITLGGSVGIDHVVGCNVLGRFYAVKVTAGTTLAAAAAALASLINVDTPASASGAVITLAATQPASAGVGVQATAVREVRRQEQRFQVTVWAPTPALRAAAARAVDLVLADTPRLTMPDNGGARLVYFGTSVIDTAEKAASYRQDLFYTVEYATLQTEQEQQVVNMPINVSVMPVTGQAGAASAVNQFGATAKPTPANASVYGETTIGIQSGVLTVDLASATTFNVLLDQSISQIRFLNRPNAGFIQRVELVLTQDATGGRALPATAWPTGTQAPAGQAPALSSAPGAQDRIVVEVGATATFVVLVGKQQSAIN